MKNHLLTVADLTVEDIEGIFELTDKLKEEVKNGVDHPILAGKALGMIFQKSSTRTRVSFETGMFQLGGHALFLSSNDIQLGRGESISDTAKTLSRYIDGIMIRTYDHSDVEELAEEGTVPVINGLTDLLHPCQILADLYTIQEKKGNLEGKKLAYLGDGNNIANSLLLGTTKVGMDVAIATPDDYKPNSEIIAKAKKQAEKSGSKVEIIDDPEAAVKDADAVYTDTWASMGDEDEKEARMKDFDGYQVTTELMSTAKDDAIFLHCLPAYRGQEMTDEVIDGPQSVVFDEAENRMHVQKAIMAKLMADNEGKDL
ncbi:MULTISPECIES: ornithine carbamoyltransferase [unclassified Candidatus Frackibacter]|uniref:ornithine carbamoyltransferase n=1 Tax=unclassified Candidatus Frackibacter TaxID=2648818 RepID=UPI00079C5008|nr:MULTISPECIES: ornithine carbamoyltransferase [unclassified Candidatus Frackibacter]KXS44928.1 MAG: ornithine carbamoyltransferase [Candidatus Frackibacter sp. T328-2]SDB97286.1 ornithine carbamoyltransferase [Candidatus Frackibacter sp. WG11]SEM28966.1 ornithine carbamoyltransferase [Candidatus Frackibacter sp. WG12]SFL33802.1 ornithine carbamoyltransferase [Candidatus Frackibacter sp. WG13]